MGRSFRSLAAPVALAFAGVLLGACANQAPNGERATVGDSSGNEPPVAASAANHNNLYATLYLRSAAEYKALARTVYGAAATSLDALVANKQHSAALEQQTAYIDLPPAVIVDVDETVLDNSAYQGTLVAENKSYNTPHWDRWVADAKAGPVPGAVDFALAAQSRGVTMLYLTNRRCIQREQGGDPCPQRAETINNLKDVGFPEPDPGNVYLRSAEFDFASDKGSRRKSFAERYRIIMLFGDDLGDFASGTRGPEVTPADRAAVVGQNNARWGRDWFVLPNPSYGSWLNVLGDDLYESLEPWQDGGN